MSAMKVIRRNLIITVAVVFTMLFTGSLMNSGRHNAMSASTRIAYEQQVADSDSAELTADYDSLDSIELNVG